MRLHQKTIILGAAAALSTASAAAEDLFPGSLTGSAALTTEYVFRGISQTDEDPAVQASLDYAVDIFENGSLYLGIWGSNVDFNDGDEAHVEIDLYGGIKGKLDGFAWDLGLIYYAYPGADNRLDYDFVEGKASLGHDFGFASLTGTIFYSPDFFAGSDDAVYLLGQLAVPLPHDFALSAQIGHQWVSDNDRFGLPDYLTWGIGLSWTIKGITLAASYFDTDISGSRCEQICDARAVVSVSASF